MPVEPEMPDDAAARHGTRDWPHAPPHRLSNAGIYFVTARTRDGHHLLGSSEKRDAFQAALFELVEKYGWRLQAWAIFSDHYHLVAHSPSSGVGGAGNLSAFIRHLHSAGTREVNRLDGALGHSGRWQNCRETHLTLQRGYLARLNYVHRNAVHHKLVALATD